MSNLSLTAAQSKESLDMGTAAKYPEIISSLPKEYCPGTSGYLYQYQGFWYPLPPLEGVIAVQQNFHAQATDIFLCSAPKTGTTWLKALCFAIQTRSITNEKSNPLLSKLPHLLVPWIEGDLAVNPKNRDLDHNLPLLLATHMSYTSLPESIQKSGSKIIYICREPKATLTSYAYFANKIKMNDDSEATSIQQDPFQEMFQQFCEGIYPGGPYWDHVLGYWKASLERPDAVLFLKYEDLKKDILLHIRKIAEFMGKPFSAEEEKDGVPQKIADMCSFDNLSNLDVNKNGKHQASASVTIPNSAFFRRGAADDWKNHLTQEMIQKVDQITQQKLLGSNFSFGV